MDLFQRGHKTAGIRVLRVLNLSERRYLVQCLQCRRLSEMTHARILIRERRGSEYCDVDCWKQCTGALA